MDRGGCRLNGGQGGESGGPSSGAGGGMITLEDLESFSEDQQSDSANGSLEEGETMADDEQERLLHYWQDVARGHQVEVPRGKTGFARVQDSWTLHACFLSCLHFGDIFVDSTTKA